MLPDDWQERHLRSAEAAAWPRFDPALDVDLAFAAVFDGLGRTRRFREGLAAASNKLAAVLSHDLRDDAPAPLCIVRETAEITSRLLAHAAAASVCATIDFDEIVRTARTGIEASWEIRSEGAPDRLEGTETQVADSYRHDANKAADLLGEAIDVCESQSSDAANRRLLLLRGPAGSGKTHLLLHIARERLLAGQATIVLFGDRFSGAASVQEYGARLGLDRRYSLFEMLDQLEETAASTDSRSLLLIDAINETTTCEIWQAGLPWLEEVLADHPHVGVALSLRDGFEGVVATKEFLERTLVVEHPGFARNLWDAVQAFFSYYNVQWPEIPLLGPEFTNPLFLKLFSSAFSGEKPRSFRGHEGGTHIFEAYAKQAGPRMNRELGRDDASPQHVWTELVKPIATWMGEQGAEEIPVEEARIIAEGAFPGRGGDALASAESHALLMKSPRFNREGKVTHHVLRFSYQKFSDHLIVRFLLNRHFDPAEPTKAFKPGTRLGRIAHLQVGRGLLEALAAQVPERTNGEWELPDLVSDEVAKSWQMTAAFLDSLVWRKPEALGQHGIDYINAVIAEDPQLEGELFDVLLSVASIPGFRLNARALHRRLSSWPLFVRDQVWTRWLRYQYADEGTAVDRLVTWARRAPGREQVTAEAALLTCIALSWLFVTPNRFLRDDATKSAVALLQYHPAVIPELLILFDRVDDPYVVERVLCAAFGALNRHPDPTALEASSRVLIEGFFSRADTTHILTRDYARGIVELAVNAGVLTDGEAAIARPPYGSEFPDEVPSQEELRQTYAGEDGYVRDYGSIWHSVMAWDFARYVIGTNTGNTAWSNRRLGERAPLTVDEKWRLFEVDLDEYASEAYQAWRESRGAESILALLESYGGRGGTNAEGNAPKEPRLQAEFRRHLTPEQTLTLEELLVAERERPARDDGFDLRIEQSWVFMRCLELGWTKERFGEADAGPDWSRSDTRKTERIGKKYQWIAHHEFLGMLADNFALKPEWGTSEPPEYHGPWVDFLRDIDPTCLADGLSHHRAPQWCDLPAHDPDSTKGDDAEWLATIEDLVDPLTVIELADDAGVRWLSLEGSHEWRRPPAPGVDEYEVLHRRVWYEIQGYLVGRERVAEFVEWAAGREFMGRWMPENQPFTEVYLREFPESVAFEDFAVDAGDERSGWVTEVRGGDLDVPLRIATDGCSGSPADRDCSVKESFSVRLPSEPLVRGLGLSQASEDGAWVAGDALVAFDPSVETDAPRRLLIQRSVLEDYLEKNQLSLVWTVLAAKELSGGWDGSEDRYARTEISGCYALQAGRIAGAIWVTSDAVNEQRPMRSAAGASLGGESESKNGPTDLASTQD